MYVLGFDGGGTRCRMAVWNSERTVVWHKEGTSSNQYAVGFDRAASAVLSLLDSFLTDTGTGREQIASLCFGSAGLGRADDQRKWNSFFVSYFGRQLPILLCGDAEILLAGSHLESSGLVLIAGTGSICLGRNRKGQTVRAGGMGTALGDEGSAWWIAKEAIRRTLRSLEGRDMETGLLPELLVSFNLNDLDDCIRFFNKSMPVKAEVAAFAARVSSRAEQKDPLATDILHQAADELALMIESVVARLEKPYLQAISYAGGVIENNKLVQRLLAEKTPPELRLVEKKGTALEGALILAASLAGNS